MTYSGWFCHRNSSCTRKIVTLMFLDSWIHTFIAKLSDRCFCWFRPPFSLTSWRLHKNLYKFGLNISPDISHMKNCTDQSLGESLNIFTSFHFPDSGILNGFDFYLIWRDTENQQLKFILYCQSSCIKWKP